MTRTTAQGDIPTVRRGATSYRDRAMVIWLMQNQDRLLLPEWWGYALFNPSGSDPLDPFDKNDWLRRRWLGVEKNVGERCVLLAVAASSWKYRVWEGYAPGRYVVRVTYPDMGFELNSLEEMHATGERFYYPEYTDDDVYRDVILGPYHGDDWHARMARDTWAWIQKEGGSCC